MTYKQYICIYVRLLLTCLDPSKQLDVHCIRLFRPTNLDWILEGLSSSTVEETKSS